MTAPTAPCPRPQGRNGPEDTTMALAALFDVLLTVCKVMAPFTPFFTGAPRWSCCGVDLSLGAAGGRASTPAASTASHFIVACLPPAAPQRRCTSPAVFTPLTQLTFLFN